MFALFLGLNFPLNSWLPKPKTSHLSSLLDVTYSKHLWQAARINWLFVKQDLGAVVLPGVTLTLYSLFNPAAPLHSTSEAIALCLESLVYFWVALTFFCVSNQLFGIAEDRINKPDRPIASGTISISQAQLLCGFSGGLLLVFGLYLHIFSVTACSFLLTLLHNFSGLSGHWFTKNVLTALGLGSALTSGWLIASPLNSLIVSWIIFLSSVWLVLGSIQDLRDIEGDRQIGRNTLPIVMGERLSRYGLSLGFCLLPLVMMAFVRLQSLELSAALLVWMALNAGLSWLIAVRTVRCQMPPADDRTYTIFLILYLSMIWGACTFVLQSY